MAGDAGGGLCRQSVAGGDPGRPRVAEKGAGGPHPGSAMDRAGATDSYGGGEGDGVRGVAYGAISRSKYSVYGWGGGFRGAQSRRRKSRLSE